MYTQQSKLHAAVAASPRVQILDCYWYNYSQIALKYINVCDYLYKTLTLFCTVIYNTISVKDFCLSINHTLLALFNIYGWLFIIFFRTLIFKRSWDLQKFPNLILGKFLTQAIYGTLIVGLSLATIVHSLLHSYYTYFACLKFWYKIAKVQK